MATVGKIDLKADRDASAAVEISVSELFSYAERTKKVTLDTDVTRDQTKLKVTIAKLGTLDIIADTTEKKDGQASLFTLMKRDDLWKKIKASKAIKKEDTLTVNIETV